MRACARPRSFSARSARRPPGGLGRLPQVRRRLAAATAAAAAAERRRPGGEASASLRCNASMCGCGGSKRRRRSSTDGDSGARRLGQFGLGRRRRFQRRPRLDLLLLGRRRGWSTGRLQRAHERVLDRGGRRLGSGSCGSVGGRGLIFFFLGCGSSSRPSRSSESSIWTSMIASSVVSSRSRGASLFGGLVRLVGFGACFDTPGATCRWLGRGQDH